MLDVNNENNTNTYIVLSASTWSGKNSLYVPAMELDSNEKINVVSYLTSVSKVNVFM